MMKSFFKKLAFVMALAMVVSMAAPAGSALAAGLTVAYQNGGAVSELNVKAGAEQDLKFLGAPKNWKEIGADWTSSNDAVATVDKAGVVTAVADGTAIITITVGDLTGSVTVNVGEVKAYDVTLGTADNKAMTAEEVKVGAKLDLNFYGVKDWNKNNYTVAWAVSGDAVTVDNTGVVTGVKAGKAVVSLTLVNNVTGATHNVTPVEITVPSDAVAGITVAQKTEVSFELTFDNLTVDLEKLAKNEIEVYEQHVDAETGVEHLYIWQINKIAKVKDKANTVLVTGYTTNELLDETTYVVKYVVPNADEDLVETIAETKFEASVGDVVKLETSYYSYLNNQEYFTFSDVAYTTAGEGEDILVWVDYTLYDDQNIDVTGHYYRANDNQDLITLELVSEDELNIFELDEDDNTLVFNDFPEGPYVEFVAIYDDYVADPVEDTIKMVVKEAPQYKITSIDKWGVNVTSGAMAANNYDKLKDWVALYDDYDVIDMDPLENHEIVLWFTDNYGNKYVTNDLFDNPSTGKKVNGSKYYYYLENDNFASEGYEIYFESKSPQVLVVGDEYDEATTSNVITTKKSGTATVNVTLQNASEDTIFRAGVLKVSVKAARYVKNVTVDEGTVKLTTDSLPYVYKTNAAGDTWVERFGTYDDAGNKTEYADHRAGDTGFYDTRFTAKDQGINVTDNYGDIFGIYNNTLRDSLTVAVEATNITSNALDNDDVAMTPYANVWWAPYPINIDGVKVDAAIGAESVNTVKFNVVATDAANEKEAKTTFRVSLNRPKYVGTTEESNIKLDNKVDVRADGTYGYTSTANLLIPIKVVETSNGYDVNYADGIELITDIDRYNEVIVNKTAEVAVGDRFIAVFDPKGKIVPAFVEDTIEVDGEDVLNLETDDFGIEAVEHGNYLFHYADTKGGVAGTRFATAGSYTVKYMEITKTAEKEIDGEDVVVAASNGVSTTTEKFKLKDDCMEITYKDQSYIYVDSDTLVNFEKTNNGDNIAEIAADAFTYSETLNNKPVRKEIGGVRYTVNKKANSVVIKDVFFKVYIDMNADGDWNDGAGWDSANNRPMPADQTFWYYVETSVPEGKTVGLESYDLVPVDGSVEYRKDPDGRKIQ